MCSPFQIPLFCALDGRSTARFDIPKGSRLGPSKQCREGPSVPGICRSPRRVHERLGPWFDLNLYLVCSHPQLNGCFRLIRTAYTSHLTRSSRTGHSGHRRMAGDLGMADMDPMLRRWTPTSAGWENLEKRRRGRCGRMQKQSSVA